MSKIKLYEVGDIDLTNVIVRWSTKYGCPVFLTPDGKKWTPMTGEYAGYFEVTENDHSITEIQGKDDV